MASFDPANTDVIFLIVSGGKGALNSAALAQALVDEGNQVNVVATPTAVEWIDNEQIQKITGWPVRYQMRNHAEATFEPLAGRIIATPVTLNTLTKWASGHADNLAIGLLCEGLGMNIPIEAEIQLSSAFAAHPATAPAIATLRSFGVKVTASPTGAPLPG